MAEIERLTTVFDANMQRFDAAIKKFERTNTQTSNRFVKQWTNANDNVGKSFAKGSLTGALEGLSSRAPGAAAGLQSLGVAGLAAGAALAALAIAGQQAMAAMAFGDELLTVSNRIGITAEELQELRYAFDEVDIAASEGEEALKKLNAALGAYRTGVGDAKVKKVFEVLGLTPEDLKGVTTATQLLPILADRIRNVGSAADQENLAKRLGIAELLPLLREGSNGLAEMREEARKLGLVIDNETVEALAQADRQMELASKQIKSNLTVAFSGLAVDIANATTALLTLINKFQDMADKTPQWVKKLAELSKYANLAALPIEGVKNAYGKLFPEQAPIRARGQAAADAQASNAAAILAASPSRLSSSSGGRGKSAGAAVDPYEASNRFAELQTKINDILYNEQKDREELGQRFGEAFAKFQKDKMGEAFGKAFTDFIQRSDAGQAAEVYWEQEAKRLQDAEYDATYNGIRSALQAVADGDAIDYFADRLRAKLLDNIADALTNALNGAQGGGGFLGGIAQIAKFAGFFATGGHIPAGQFGITGERGPEIVSGPANITPIRPGSALGRSGPSVVQNINFDTRGAVMTTDLLNQMNMMARRAEMNATTRSLQGARKGAPALQNRMTMLGTV